MLVDGSKDMRVINRQPHWARVYRLGLVYSDILLPLPLDVELVDCVDFLPERRYDRGAQGYRAVQSPGNFWSGARFPPRFPRGLHSILELAASPLGSLLASLDMALCAAHARLEQRPVRVCQVIAAQTHA